MFNPDPLPAAPARQAAAGHGRHIPGEPGLWVMIFGDLLVFSLFFLTFADYRISEHALFAAGRAQLSQDLGLLNTLLLLTSSFAVASGLQALRAGKVGQARRATLAGIVLGLGFVAVKFFEYHAKFAAGLYPTTNDFFMFYFAFTGIHLIHVLIGLGALGFIRHSCQLPLTTGRLAAVEACAVFWHLVDILWVILFAVVYLHP